MLSDAECLRQVNIFRDLSTDQLEALALRAHRRHFADGDVIFREGDASHNMYIVIAGEVKITEPSPRPNGREILLAIMQPYDVLGELGILDGGPRSATATAVGHTELLGLSQNDVTGLLEREPAVVRSVLTAVVGIVRESNKRLVVITTHDVPARMGRAFLDLAERHGYASSVGTVIDKPVTYAELAELAALDVFAVQRWLSAMQYNDVIRFEDGRYTIRRQDVLERMLKTIP